MYQYWWNNCEPCTWWFQAGRPRRLQSWLWAHWCSRQGQRCLGTWKVILNFGLGISALLIQHSLIMLQSFLVDVKEACSIRKAGVGVERVRGAHWRGDVEQVIGHCHLIVRWTYKIRFSGFDSDRLLCVQVLENGFFWFRLHLNQIVPQIHIDAPAWGQM